MPVSHWSTKQQSQMPITLFSNSSAAECSYGGDHETVTLKDLELFYFYLSGWKKILFFFHYLMFMQGQNIHGNCLFIYLF